MTQTLSGGRWVTLKGGRRVFISENRKTVAIPSGPAPGSPELRRQREREIAAHESRERRPGVPGTHTRELYAAYEAAAEANRQARAELDSQYRSYNYAPKGKRDAYQRKVNASGRAFHRLVNDLNQTQPPPPGRSTWSEVKPSEIRDYFRSYS